MTTPGKTQWTEADERAARVAAVRYFWADDTDTITEHDTEMADRDASHRLMVSMLRVAILTERERCAAVCRGQYNDTDPFFTRNHTEAAEACAAAILAGPGGAMSEKTIRCTACGGEFTDEEVNGHTACPSCDHRGVPMDIAKDVTIQINIHELRILTIWAGAWAAAHRVEDPSMGAALDGILCRLRRQLPGVGFTLADDIQEVASATGSRATLVVGGVTEVFDPKVKQ